MYMATQRMSHREQEQLKQIFVALDKNGDGVLTFEELLEGYTKLYNNPSRALAEVQALLANADADNNGTIDYTGMIFCLL